MAATPADPLSEVVASVSRKLDGFAGAYARRGFRVTGLEADADNGDSIPDLLIYVDHDDYPGERVVRYPLGRDGALEGPGDAAVSAAFVLYEFTAAQFGRLPLSNRA